MMLYKTAILNQSNKAHVMPVKVEILALSLHIVFVQGEVPAI